MNFTTKTFAVCLLSALLISSCALIQPKKNDNESHIGTWQLIAYNYGNKNEFTFAPKEKRRIKFITATHFFWTEYNKKDGEILGSAGGTYDLDEDVYIETIEFADEAMFSFIGKEQNLKINVTNDELHQLGKLSNGLEIEEVWQRIK